MIDSTSRRSRRPALPGEPMAFVERAIDYDDDACLIWPYARSAGYGALRVDGRVVHAHRVVLERSAGPPPAARMDAAHAPVICHERACVNPRHLRWATREENESDKALDGTNPRGSRNGFSRLTESDVLRIVEDSRPVRAIGKEYGVSHQTVSDIKTGRRWSHVTRRR